MKPQRILVLVLVLFGCGPEGERSFPLKTTTHGDVRGQRWVVGRTCSGTSNSVNFGSGGAVADSGCPTPLPGVRLTFGLADGSSAEAVTDEAGRYRLELDRDLAITQVRILCSGTVVGADFVLNLMSGSQPSLSESAERIGIELEAPLCLEGPGPGP